MQKMKAKAETLQVFLASALGVLMLRVEKHFHRTKNKVKTKQTNQKGLASFMLLHTTQPQCLCRGHFFCLNQFTQQLQ